MSTRGVEFHPQFLGTCSQQASVCLFEDVETLSVENEIRTRNRKEVGVDVGLSLGLPLKELFGLPANVSAGLKYSRRCIQQVYVHSVYTLDEFKPKKELLTELSKIQDEDDVAEFLNRRGAGVVVEERRMAYKQRKAKKKEVAMFIKAKVELLSASAEWESAEECHFPDTFDFDAEPSENDLKHLVAVVTRVKSWVDVISAMKDLGKKERERLVELFSAFQPRADPYRPIYLKHKGKYVEFVSRRSWVHGDVALLREKPTVDAEYHWVEGGYVKHRNRAWMTKTSIHGHDRILSHNEEDRERVENRAESKRLEIIVDGNTGNVRLGEMKNWDGKVGEASVEFGLSRGASEFEWEPKQLRRQRVPKVASATEVPQQEVDAVKARILLLKEDAESVDVSGLSMEEAGKIGAIRGLLEWLAWDAEKVVRLRRVLRSAQKTATVLWSSQRELVRDDPVNNERTKNNLLSQVDCIAHELEVLDFVLEGDWAVLDSPEEYCEVVKKVKDSIVDSKREQELVELLSELDQQRDAGAFDRVDEVVDQLMTLGSLENDEEEEGGSGGESTSTPPDEDRCSTSTDSSVTSSSAFMRRTGGDISADGQWNPVIVGVLAAVCLLAYRESQKHE